MYLIFPSDPVIAGLLSNYLVVPSNIPRRMRKYPQNHWVIDAVQLSAEYYLNKPTARKFTVYPAPTNINECNRVLGFIVNPKFSANLGCYLYQEVSAEDFITVFTLAQCSNWQIPYNDIIKLFNIQPVKP